MMKLLCALLFAISAFAKVRILTFHCNNPDFVEMQYKCLSKFLLDDFELIVFNDAKTAEMEKEIEQRCQKHHIPCIRFQPEWHLTDPLNAYLKQRLQDPAVTGWWGWTGSTPIAELANHPSVRHSHLIQYALDRFGYGHDDVVVLMDGDNFLIKQLSVSDLLKSYDIVGFHQRGDELAKQRRQGAATVPKGTEMLWVVFIAFDPRKLPDVRDMRFHVDVVSGHHELPHNTISDTGAAIYKYLKTHPELRIQAYLWQDSYGFRCMPQHERKRLSLSDELMELNEAIAPENVQLFMYEHFVHFSAGSVDSVDLLRQKKLFHFRKFLESLVSDPQAELRKRYEHSCHQPSDINEHIETLRFLAQECASVTEIGLRTMVSSWGILLGLSENPSERRSYLGIDLDAPPIETLTQAKQLAEENGISFRFWQADDRTIELETTDMLFIDSLHTYCHLTYELETFSSKVSKYIALHDTSWENVIDDPAYHGDYSEYPPSYNRARRGLWAAVEDFLQRHPEWILHKRYLNNNGFTILKRSNSY